MAQFVKNNEPRFVVLIGDLVASRELVDRAGVQRALLAALEALNAADARSAPGPPRTPGAPKTSGPAKTSGRRSAPDEDGASLGSSGLAASGALAAPLALTAGDEVQALLRRADGAVSLVIALTEAIFPARIVFGLGWGALSTDLEENVAHLDGPCFHAARRAVEAARRSRRWAVVEGFGDPADHVLSALFHLMGVIRSGWTAKQARTVRQARTMLQKDVAAGFGVSPSVVSESLRAAGFEALRHGEDAAGRLLREFGSEAESMSTSAQSPNQPFSGTRGG